LNHPFLKQGLGVLLAVLGLPGLAMAQVSMSVVLPGNQVLPITAKDAPRPDNSLILYTPDYGQSTRTNPYGVEVIAKSLGTGHQYRVEQVVSVWDCKQDCGNASIPADGIVLSAIGPARDALKTLKPGQVIEVQSSWFARNTMPLSVTNPSPFNNPLGSGFPGYRASNQLIVYDKDYGQSSTGTNEFGFEVTVVDGVVMDQEGSDSRIPGNGFVLSGHGRGRSWLIANAPVGARITVEDGQVVSEIDPDTYRFQLVQRLESTQERLTPAQRQDFEKAMRELDKRIMQGPPEAAAELAQATLDKLNRTLWPTYAQFSAQSMRGAWHRPVEKSPAAIGQTLDALKAAGINTVFLETFFHGYTIFPSETYARYGLVNQNPKFAGFDPLKAWLDEAHKRNMKVHVWFETFYGGSKAFQPPGPILSKYPAWANVQRVALDKTEPTPSNLELGHYFLDPANPDVQTFLLSVIDEITTRYPVDGFQLDYIRYPASFPPDRYSYLKTTWGYTPVARARFQQETGVDPANLKPEDPQWEAWNQFKAGIITDFVRQVSERVRPRQIKLSAAVFPTVEDSLLRKHQNWSAWDGYVDFFAPMTLTSAVKSVGSNTGNMVQKVRVPVMSGVFGPFNQNTAEHMLEQLDAAKANGASGFVLFDTAHLTRRMLEALETIVPKKP
jgi:uncharacterized lipoprotein YddW (UPF0748 family)